MKGDTRSLENSSGDEVRPGLGLGFRVCVSMKVYDLIVYYDMTEKVGIVCLSRKVYDIMYHEIKTA